MTAKTTRKRTRANGNAVEDELTRYGITRVPTDYFHYGDYKYTDLKDAVAQAKRDLKAAPKPQEKDLP